MEQGYIIDLYPETQARSWKPRPWHWQRPTI